MSQFAIDSLVETGYTSAAPQGVNHQKIFENKQLAGKRCLAPGTW
jgi:hypothetical protein